LTGWIAYLELEPPDDPAHWDWRFAMLASVTAQSNGVKPHKAKLKNFMPQRKVRASVQTPTQQAKILEAFTGSVMPDEISKRFH